MQINWFEVFAQILNFFILLFLLNKFLFKPVMAAMEKREEEIANTVKNAEVKLAEAESLVENYEKKISEIKLQEDEKMEVMARIRYRQPLEKATLHCTHSGLYIIFDNPQS